MNFKKITFILFITLSLFISGCGHKEEVKGENKEEKIEYLVVNTKYKKIDKFLNKLFEEQKIAADELYFNSVSILENGKYFYSFESENTDMFLIFDKNFIFNGLKITYERNIKDSMNLVKKMTSYSYFDISEKDIDEINDSILNKKNGILYYSDFVVINTVDEKYLSIVSHDFLLSIVD